MHGKKESGGKAAGGASTVGSGKWAASVSGHSAWPQAAGTDVGSRASKCFTPPRSPPPLKTTTNL